MAAVQQMLLGSAGAAATDPFWTSVVFSSDFTALPNGTTSFTDVAKGKAITTVGGASATTSLSPWGTSSLVLNGNGDWLQTPDSADFAMGTGDFTFEVVASASVATREMYFLTQALSLGGFTPLFGGRATDNSAYQRWSDGSVVFTSTPTTSTPLPWPVNTFKHVAFSRVGNTLYSAFDGTIYATSSAVGLTLFDSTGPLTIGSYGPTVSSTLNWAGNIAAVRITKGVGRYTANYTPPSGPFPTS